MLVSRVENPAIFPLPEDRAPMGSQQPAKVHCREGCVTMQTFQPLDQQMAKAKRVTKLLVTCPAQQDETLSMRSTSDWIYVIN